MSEMCLSFAFNRFVLFSFAEIPETTYWGGGGWVKKKKGKNFGCFGDKKFLKILV